MRLVEERGLLTPKAEQPPGLNQVVTDSSAGRVAVPDINNEERRT